MDDSSVTYLLSLPQQQQQVIQTRVSTSFRRQDPGGQPASRKAHLGSILGAELYHERKNAEHLSCDRLQRNAATRGMVKWPEQDFAK